MLTERQKQLFEDILSYYVKTSEPISSNALVASGRWDVSSATLRNEMAALERAGLIMQPHTSAGRVPTEKGYQLYRNEFLEPDIIEKALDRALSSSYRDHSEESLKNLARELARISELAVILGTGNNSLYYTGLRHLLDQPEFESLDELYDILELLEARERELLSIVEHLPVDTAILIGQENPVLPFGTFIATSVPYKGTRQFIGIFGPMRMEYGKMVSLVRRCSHLLTE